MLTPSTSESRTNSCRDGVQVWPVRVRNAIAPAHSAWVGRTSATNACRCRTSASPISCSRGVAAPAMLALVAFVIRLVPSGLFTVRAGVRRLDRLPDPHRLEIAELADAVG